MSKIRRRKKIKTSEWLFGLYRFRVEIEGTKAHTSWNLVEEALKAIERERVGVGLVMVFSLNCLLGVWDFDFFFFQFSYYYLYILVLLFSLNRLCIGFQLVSLKNMYLCSCILELSLYCGHVVFDFEFSRFVFYFEFTGLVFLFWFFFNL